MVFKSVFRPRPNAQNAAHSRSNPNRCKKTIMIIRNLYNLFCGSESQNGRLDSIPPSETVEKENTTVIIPGKFKDDVERLCNYCGVKFKSGLCIELELSELLEILPRERRRKDSYDKVVKFLAEEMKITLTIKSRRSNK